MVDRGLLRRVAAILFHRRAGFSANGMGVWQVPDEHIAEVGPRMAAYRGISHCYQRPTYADWPYSIFTMAHGRSKEECDAILDAIAAENPEIQDRATLYSSTEFKKIRLLYFTEDFKRLGTRARGRLMARLAHRHPLGRALRPRAAAPARRRQLAGARDGRHRPRPGLHRARRTAPRSSTSTATTTSTTCARGGRSSTATPTPRSSPRSSRRPSAGRRSARRPQGEVDLAEEIARRVPSVEMVRMTSSGTEATMSAIRLARAATGREKLLKFAGAYHGHVDGLLAAGGLGPGHRRDPGQPRGDRRPPPPRRSIVPWNDPEARRCGPPRSTSFAAILAEPFAANMGLVAPAEGFLDLLRERASATGALLVFDEVITGFRVARGGAQELAGVMPDLTVMGKVIGGGLPAAAYGGPRALMELVAPAGDVYQAGTLSGNPLAVAAGLATLQLLDERAYACLTARTETLAAGLREAAGDLPVHVVTAPGPAHRLLLGRRPCATTRAPRPATTPPSPPGAAACWPAASTRRRRSTRRGSRRWRTTPSTSSARSTPPPRPSGRRSEPGAGGRARRPAGGGRPAGRRPGARARPRTARSGAAAAAGPRSRGREADVAFVVEAIREGELLHYGAPRLFGAIEPDLALLAGDRLYALGLARLARAGRRRGRRRAGRRHRAVRPGARRGAPGAGRRRLAGGRGRGRLGRVGRRCEAAKAAARAGDPGAARRPPARHRARLAGP